MPHAFDEDPVEAFKRNVYVSPFHEDDLGKLVEVMGADHILFGSDYPHPEGLAEPCSYLDHLPPGMPARGPGQDHGRQPRKDHASRSPHRLTPLDVSAFDLALDRATTYAET